MPALEGNATALNRLTWGLHDQKLRYRMPEHSKAQNENFLQENDNISFSVLN